VFKAASLLVGVVLAASACASGHGGHSAATAAKESTVLDGGSSRRPAVVRRVKVGALPYDAVAAFGSIWIAATGGVVRFDRVSGRFEGRTSIPEHGEWMNVAAGGGSIWYTAGASLWTVAPSNGRVVRTIRLGPATGREAYEFVGASSHGACVSQIAPSSRAGLICVAGTKGSVMRVAAGPGPIAGAADGSLWVGGPSLTRLTLTPRTMTSTPLPRKASVAAVAASGSSVWAAVNFTPTRAEVWKIRHGRVVRRFAVPHAWVVALAPAHGRVWLLTQRLHAHTSEVAFLSPSGGLTAVHRVAPESRALVAATDSSVWTVDYRAGTATIVTLPR